MVGMGPKRHTDGVGVYPPIGALLSMVGLEGIGVYIDRRQITAAQYIATCPIFGYYLVVNIDLSSYSTNTVGVIIYIVFLSSTSMHT